MKNFLNIVNKNKLFIFIVSAFIVVVATFIPTYYDVSSFAGGSNISSTPVNLGILFFTNDLSFFGICIFLYILYCVIWGGKVYYDICILK